MKSLKISFLFLVSLGFIVSARGQEHLQEFLKDKECDSTVNSRKSAFTHQLHISTGVGWSMVTSIMYKGAFPLGNSLVFGSGSFSTFPSFGSISPVYGFAVDRGIKNFAIGVAGAFQTFTVTPYRANPNYEEEILNRYNLTLELLFPLARFKDEKGMLYGGIRGGVTYWTDKLPPDLNPVFSGTLSGSTSFFPSIRVLLGVRYFFVMAVGLKAELGIGAPCLAEVGFVFRFYTKPSSTNTHS